MVGDTIVYVATASVAALAYMLTGDIGITVLSAVLIFSGTCWALYEWHRTGRDGAWLSRSASDMATYLNLAADPTGQRTYGVADWMLPVFSLVLLLVGPALGVLIAINWNFNVGLGIVAGWIALLAIAALGVWRYRIPKPN